VASGSPSGNGFKLSLGSGTLFVRCDGRKQCLSIERVCEGELRKATWSIDRVQVVSRREPFLALNDRSGALIGFLIQKWEHQEEYIGIQ